MYSRLTKAFYFLSIFFFLIVLMFIYSSSPEFVTYELSDRGLPLKQISKELFFYLFLGIFVVSNVLLIVPAKLIELQYNLTLKKLFPKGGRFREMMLVWIYSFAGMVNFSSIILVFYLHRITHIEEFRNSSFSFFFYLVPIIFVGWILGLFYILIQKMKEVKEGQAPTAYMDH